MAQIEQSSGGKKKKGAQKKMAIHVDFTPMVDMNMLLITFFMLCTTMIKSQTLSIALPTNEKLQQEELQKAKESEAITLILDTTYDDNGGVKDNTVYYYTGKPVTEFNGSDLVSSNIQVARFEGNEGAMLKGIRKILHDRNEDVLKKVEEQKDRWRNKQITEEQFQAEAKKIRNDEKLTRPVVIIKPMEGASWESVIAALAKDVDLSSKEWTDIIFEGKNKEFGAYDLRKQSDRRHNRAVLFTLIGLVVVLIGGYFWGMYSDFRMKQHELELQAQLEQQLAAMEAQEEEMQEEEEVIEAVQEPEQEEALPEEILNTIKDTEIAIAADNEVTEDITSKDEVQESTAAAGASTFDQGTDNLEVVRTHKDEIIVEEKKPEPVKEEVFTAVEQMPQFPGGEAELLKYVATHIKYPTMAAENNIQGGKDPDLDKEAVRVVKTLPKFIPGKMNGQAVSVWYTLPINFKLQQ